jgi:hypothetical protein
MVGLILLGCAMGPNEETLVDELRVLAVQADAPEVGPGETVGARGLVVDPLGAGYDALYWTCTPTGPEGCLEGSGEALWDGLAVVEDPGDPWLSAGVTASEALGAFASEEPQPLILQWVLACEPGLCAPIEAALRAPAAGSSEGEQLRAWLADPFEAAASLPLEGVSLALQPLNVSTRPLEERATHPSVACGPEDITVSVGGSQEFECAVEGGSDETALWGYATAGGWEAPEVALGGEASVAYTFFAPEEAPEDFGLWVIAADGEGGVGIWEGAACCGTE